MLNDKRLILPIILSMTSKSSSNVEVGGTGKDGMRVCVWSKHVWVLKPLRYFLKYLLAIRWHFE